MDFRMETEDRDGTFVISLIGEFDLAAAEIAAGWASALNGQTQVEVDLTGLTFMDSSGLRELLRLREAMEASGRGLALRVEPGSQVDRVFDLAGLKSRFTFSD